MKYICFWILTAKNTCTYKVYDWVSKSICQYAALERKLLHRIPPNSQQIVYQLGHCRCTQTRAHNSKRAIRANNARKNRTQRRKECPKCDASMRTTRRQHPQSYHAVQGEKTQVYAIRDLPLFEEESYCKHHKRQTKLNLLRKT